MTANRVAQTIFLTLVAVGIGVFMWQIWDGSILRGFLTMLGIWAMSLVLAALALVFKKKEPDYVPRAVRRRYPDHR